MKLPNELKAICENQKDDFLSEHGNYIDFFLEQGLKLKFNFRFTNRFHIPYNDKKKKVKRFWLSVRAEISPSMNSCSEGQKFMLFYGDILKITWQNDKYNIKEISSKSFDRVLNKLVRRVNKTGADNFFRGKVSTLLLKSIMPHRYADISKDIDADLAIIGTVLFIVLELIILILKIKMIPYDPIQFFYW